MSDRCTDGRTFDRCCSDRGCTYVFSDGTALVGAADAWSRCGVDPYGDEPVISGDDPNLGATNGTRPGSPGESGPGTVEEGDPNGGPIGGGEQDPNQGEQTGTGEETGQAAGSSEACWGSPVSCGARYTSGSCEGDGAGCFWEDSYCGGAAYSCSYFSSASNCNQQGGCQWSYYYEDCRGAAWQCHQHYSSGRCYAQFGCYWVTGGCFGSAGSCARYANPSSCNAVTGCYWQ